MVECETLVKYGMLPTFQTKGEKCQNKKIVCFLFSMCLKLIMFNFITQ